MNFGSYTAHQVAEWFPLLEGAELRDLTESIKREGQIEACVVWGSVLVDGRNRWRACELAGVEPLIVAREFESEAVCARWIVATNLHRRHLTATQRAMLAARILPMFEAEARERQAVGVANLRQGDEVPVPAILPEPGDADIDPVEPAQPRHVREARSQAAEQLQVSPRAVQSAKAVLEHGSSELVAAVERGEAAIHNAEQIAKLSHEEQAEVVAAGSAIIREAAAELRKPHVANNSGQNEWYTPAPIIEAARLAMGSIDLDPASCEVANRVVKAGRYYTAEDDGLSKQWFGNVFLNPPYSSELLRQFAAAVCAKHEAGDQFVRACVIVNNATETVASQSMLDACDAVCFLKGRVKFLDQSGKLRLQPLQGQMVLYFGDDGESFRDAFQALGVVLYG